MMLYLNILTVLLLAVVAGLLMALWVQLREWKLSVRKAPLLAEELAQQLMMARKGLEDLKKNIVAQGPEVSRLLSDGNKLRVELQFLLQRAEQAGARLDADQTAAQAAAPAAVEPVTAPIPQRRVAPATVAAAFRAAQEATVQVAPHHDVSPLIVAEQVAGANGKALQPTQPSRDPLEDLLAGLQQRDSNVTPLIPAVRKRAGPVTQAELDLQQKVAG